MAASSSDRPIIQNQAVDVTDAGAREKYLDNIWLVSAAGAQTVTGYFVDFRGDKALTAANGAQAAFSGTINAAGGTPKTLASIAGLTGSVVANYPEAVGVRIVLAGDVREDVQASGSVASDFTTNYARYPRIIADPEYNTFGRAS